MLSTLVFIFYNSALPPAQSTEQSDKVSDIITSIIPEDTSLGKFIIEYIRKIAHFTEYGFLGIQVALYVMIFGQKRLRSALFGYIIPFFVGFVDETVQIWSDRGPSISDVWIDIGGFFTFSTLAYAVIVLFLLVYKKVKEIIAK